MIRATLLVCLLALPAAAQDMTREECRAGWAALNRLIEEDAEMIAVRPDVTADGLCRIDKGNAPLEQNDFESAEWRATGVAEAVARHGMPLSLTASFTGIDPIKGLKLPLAPEHMGQIGTMRLDFTRDAETRAFALLDWTTDFGELGRLSISGSGGGIDLGSLKDMQFTSGGLRIHELTLSLDTTGPLSAALLSDVPLEDAVNLVADLPDAAISEESRAALAEILRAGPSATGRLNVTARSRTGVGFLQMVGGVRTMEEAGSAPDAVARGLSILLDGVTLEVRWTPTS